MNVKGIDVSAHNGALDWKAIKDSGIDFVIIRAGYGRYEVDKRFHEYIKAALKQGLPVGIYWFSYALNIAGVKEEAKKCIETIAPYKDKIKLPVFFDFEYDTVRYARDNAVKLGKTEFNNHTVEFCEAIKAAGYIPGVYYNLDYYRTMVDKSKLKDYVVWFAQYASKPGISDYSIWQYSSSGKLPGNSCDFDMNVAAESFISKTDSSDKKPDEKKDSKSDSKLEGAKSFNPKYRRGVNFTVRANGGLNMRRGAGTNKAIITTIPNRGTVSWYGYYTDVSGVIWYLVKYKNYTGYVSSKYLR